MALADKKSALAPQQIINSTLTGRHQASPTNVQPFAQTIKRPSPVQVVPSKLSGRHLTSPTTVSQQSPLAGRHNSSPTAVVQKTPLAGE